MGRGNRIAVWSLAAITALGLGLRLWNINFGLPYTIAPDEPWHLTIALSMFRTGDLDPHWLNYPSLMFYLNALAYVPFFLVGKAVGLLSVPSDIPFPEIITVGVGRSLMPSQFVLGRGLTTLFGTGSIVLVYLIGRELYPNRLVAMLAALLFAVSPANVVNSHLIRPDTFVVFFVLLSVLYARRILDEPSQRNYAFAGIAAGLAVSSKYNVPFIVAALVVAHFLRWGRSGFRRIELYWGVALSAVAFVLTTPFALIDFQQFLHDSGFEVVKQIAGGAAGFEGNTLPWYLSFLWSAEGMVVLAAVMGAVWILWTRFPSGLVLLAFPLIYFVFISQLAVRNDRTILPVVPFLYLFAGLFALKVYDWLLSRRRFSPAVLNVSLIVVGLLSAFEPIQQSIAGDAALAEMDSREAARVWIEQNLPPGSRIAVESYSPYVDTGRFIVEGVDGMIDHSPDWYVQNGFEYLVFSYGAYGRFYENPAQYPESKQQYEDFFSRFTQVAGFDENGYAIKIFKTGTTRLPSQRVAAHFGTFAPMLEQVGYDLDVSSQAREMNLVLYWRALVTRREPLRLTAQLLDRNDQGVVTASEDLFNGTAKTDGQWPEGIVRVPLNIRLPETAAGLYRVELDVDAEGLGRIPVLSKDNTPVSDKLFLGPFKVAPTPPTANELQSAHVSGAQFGNVFELQSYRTDESARAGESAGITLYWKSIGKSNKDYTVFLHLLDSAGNIRAQVDAPPRGGAYPTSIWDVGEVIRDDYALQLPRDLPSGDYKIEVGVYEHPGLTRLPVYDAAGKPLGDHLILDDTIKVQ